MWQCQHPTHSLTIQLTMWVCADAPGKAGERSQYLGPCHPLGDSHGISSPCLQSGLTLDVVAI